MIAWGHGVKGKEGHRVWNKYKVIPKMHSYALKDFITPEIGQYIGR